MTLILILGTYSYTHRHKHTYILLCATLTIGCNLNSFTVVISLVTRRRITSLWCLREGDPEERVISEQGELRERIDGVSIVVTYLT